MCLVIKRSKFNRYLQDKLSIICCPKAKIAKKDIKVYKILCTDTVFPHSIRYTNFMWNIGIVYDTDLVVSIASKLPRVYFYSADFLVNEGFHAFVDENSAKKFISRGSLKLWKIYEAVIPKGSKYYLGDREDIVSNQLKIVRECV